MQFAQSLKKIMQEKNITNYRLAKILGVHPTTIKNWLESYTEPKFEMIDKIADALEISVMDLMLGADKATVFKQKQKKNGKKIDDMNLEELKEVTETLDFLDTITDSNQTSQQVKEQDTHIRAVISKRRKVLEAFDTLNSLGKEKAVERVEELTEIPKYTAPDTDNNDPG